MGFLAVFSVVISLCAIVPLPCHLFTVTSIRTSCRCAPAVPSIPSGMTMLNGAAGLEGLGLREGGGLAPGTGMGPATLGLALGGLGYTTQNTNMDQVRRWAGWR